MFFIMLVMVLLSDKQRLAISSLNPFSLPFSQCVSKSKKSYPIDLQAVSTTQPVQNDDVDKTATSARDIDWQAFRGFAKVLHALDWHKKKNLMQLFISFPIHAKAHTVCFCFLSSMYR